MSKRNFSIDAGIQISLDGINWFRLTDHNRSDIQNTPERIEKVNRMANGKTRKYVVASKKKVATSWDFLPSKTDATVDGYFSSEWLGAFYEANMFVPVYVKVVNSTEAVPRTGFYPNESTRVSGLTGETIFRAYISNFSSDIIRRTKDTDFVKMSVEFTEI